MKDEVSKAIEVLREGGVILYPTDTIWGLGCDATNPEAVKKVYQIKQRVDSKSMLTLIDSEGRLNSYIEEVPELAYDLIEMSTKPLTLIYPGAKNLAENLIAEDGSIGIRITENKFCKHLIERFRKPIVSTSANISGDPHPKNYDEINEKLFDLVDFAFSADITEESSSIPSSIIKIGLGGEIKIIRE